MNTFNFRHIIAFSTSLFIVGIVSAQSFSLGGGFGYGEISGDSKAFILVSGGLQHSVSRFLIFGDLNMGVGEGEGNDDFYFDESVDRCRSRSTGRFASDTFCSNAEFYFSVAADGNFVLAGGDLFAGAGVQLGEPTSLYLSGGFVLTENILIKFGAWAEYISARAILVF